MRLEARLARSNAEATVDRLRAEPARSSQDLDLAQSLLAHAHRFVNSTMKLEAALYTATEPAVPTGLEQFVRDVDATLEALSVALRRASDSVGPLGRATGEPADLRAVQNTLDQTSESSGRASAPLLLETERITNSLNTMVDLVRRVC